MQGTGELPGALKQFPCCFGCVAVARSHSQDDASGGTLNETVADEDWLYCILSLANNPDSPACAGIRNLHCSGKCYCLSFGRTNVAQQKVGISPGHFPFIIICLLCTQQASVRADAFKLPRRVIFMKLGHAAIRAMCTAWLCWLSGRSTSPVFLAG